MALNIYIISHPILKLFTNTIIYNQINTNTSQEKYIGLILIYEMIRKYIKVKQIYIKYINYIREINIIQPDQTYYIFTNLINTYNMIADIKILLPNIKIINFEENINKSFKNKTKDINKKANIIILDIILNKSSCIDLIKYLQIEINIPLHNINICCIKCYNDILEKLGTQYPKLNIYTAQIIQNRYV